jgi:arsenite methyltransferase
MTEQTEQVRARYAEIAEAVTRADHGSTAASSCCGGDAPGTGCCGGDAPGTGCCGAGGDFGSTLYGDLERASLPHEALLASLGCGNPTAVAELRAGDTVLDLGSGGGIDVLLSARRVGPTGKVYGIDMTDEMLALADDNRRRAGVDNAEFLRGHIEAIPLPPATVDVVISNCVINLSEDKQVVFHEMHRVLKSGGRIGISDIVASNSLSPADRGERGSFVGCVAGALSFAEYEKGLERAGFVDVSLTPTREVAGEMFAATVKARKPARSEL